MTTPPIEEKTEQTQSLEKEVYKESEGKFSLNELQEEEVEEVKESKVFSIPL